jgi:hypothetical protein
MLGRSWIDPVRCKRGLDALRQYRRQWDDRLQDWKRKDWTNHGCDALRTFAAGFDNPTSLRPPPEDRRRERRDIYTGWAA